MAARIQPEAGVVAAAGPAIRDVDQASVNCDADRRDPVRALDVGELEAAVWLDPQDGDLVRPRIGRQQVAAVGCSLEASG